MGSARVSVLTPCTQWGDAVGVGGGERHNQTFYKMSGSKVQNELAVRNQRQNDQRTVAMGMGALCKLQDRMKAAGEKFD